MDGTHHAWWIEFPQKLVEGDALDPAQHGKRRKLVVTWLDVEHPRHGHFTLHEAHHDCFTLGRGGIASVDTDDDRLLHPRDQHLVVRVGESTGETPGEFNGLTRKGAGNPHAQTSEFFGRDALAIPAPVARPCVRLGQTTRRTTRRMRASRRRSGIMWRRTASPV